VAGPLAAKGLEARLRRAGVAKKRRLDLQKAGEAVITFRIRPSKTPESLSKFRERSCGLPRF